MSRQPHTSSVPMTYPPGQLEAIKCIFESSKGVALHEAISTNWKLCFLNDDDHLIWIINELRHSTPAQISGPTTSIQSQSQDQAMALEYIINNSNTKVLHKAIRENWQICLLGNDHHTEQMASKLLPYIPSPNPILIELSATHIIRMLSNDFLTKCQNENSRRMSLQNARYPSYGLPDTGTIAVAPTSYSRYVNQLPPSRTKTTSLPKIHSSRSQQNTVNSAAIPLPRICSVNSQIRPTAPHTSQLDNQKLPSKSNLPPQHTVKLDDLAPPRKRQRQATLTIESLKKPCTLRNSSVPQWSLSQPGSIRAPVKEVKADSTTAEVRSCSDDGSSSVITNSVITDSIYIKSEP